MKYAALIAILFAVYLKQTATPRDVARAACPADMVEVDGEYCPAVEQLCLQWLDPPKAEPKLRCAEFKKTPPCRYKTEKMHFCIDRFEWPNREGELPALSMTWYDAKKSCAAIGKRLCESDEWTLACEGPERLPYPYGYARNSEACNIDKTYRYLDNNVYEALGTRAAEVARLDQREPSGSRHS